MPLAYSQEFFSLANFGTFGSEEGQFSSPEGIAIDQEGNVYVADTGNNRIQVFSNDGTFLLEWGGYGSGNGSLRSPEGIAIDQEGNVYVADTGRAKVQVFSSDGTYLSGWGEFGARENGTLRSPEGIAIDSSSGNVYVADTGNHRVEVFSSNGTFLSRWGGYGSSGDELRSPEGIAIDSSSGNVYVADTGNNRIRVFSSNGTYLSEWGEYGTDDSSFNSPEGIALDQEGNVYVADTGNNRIQVFSNDGTFLSEWGEYGTDDSSFNFPRGIGIDSSSGNVYVADTYNNRILGYTSRSPIDNVSTSRSPIDNVSTSRSPIDNVSTSRSPIDNVSFSSEDGQIYGNDTRIKIETVYDRLKFPTAIAFLGPDDMLVLEKEEETVKRIVNGQMLDEPVLDLANTTEIKGNSYGKGCMCDIAILQNDNNSTSYAFLYYFDAEVTEDDGKTKYVNQFYRYDITNGKLTNPKLIFEMPANPKALHNGGKVMIGPDNNVYLTTGEMDNYQTLAQNIEDGSLPDGSSAILRFTPDGEPVDGGLLGNTNPLDKYYAYGIRNSFGIGYDPVTGNIWMTDNGNAYGDELNLVMPGFNGGWHKIMGSSSFEEGFNLADLESFNGNGKYYDPIFEWRVVNGVTDLVFVPSDKIGKEYEGNIFVGDINNGYLYRFILNQSRTGLLLNDSLSDGIANDNYEMLETVFAKINGGGITDLEVGPDGLIYIVSSNGKIMRLEPMNTNP